MPTIGLFFYVKGKLLAYKVILEKAEVYGDFLTCPVSHDAVWRKRIGTKFPVDFDYFPRGRVVYNTREEKYVIYIDKCLDTTEHIAKIVEAFGLADHEYVVEFDEHYQCHKCNKDYLI